MDYVFENYEKEDICEVVRYFVSLWPYGQIQAGDADKWWPLFQHGQEIALNHEFFIYRNEDAVNDWKEHGRTDENDNLMVHVLWNASELTVVTSTYVGAMLKAYIETRRLDRRVLERMGKLLQQAHDRKVWRQIREQVVSWKTGKFHDHDGRGMAELVGVDLQTPKFLEPLLKYIDGLDLKADTEH